MADYTIFQSTTSAGTKYDSTFAVDTGGQVVAAGAVTGIVTDAGTAKNLGSNRSTLDNSALGIAEPGLYGATVASGARVGTTVIDNSIVTDSNDIGNQEEANYHMKRVASNVGQSASTSLASGASEKGSKRSKIHNVLSARVVQIATALREGKWNIYEGTFSDNAPSGVNNFAALGVDDAIGNDANNQALRGEYAFSTAGGSVISSGDYEAKGGSTS
tara:strand:- start:92 stop:742 length:651 start_codon:yes stop_codon:yes gene_type:complete